MDYEINYELIVEDIDDYLTKKMGCYSSDPEGIAFCIIQQIRDDIRQMVDDERLST